MALRIGSIEAKDLMAYRDMKVAIPSDKKIAVFFAQNGVGKSSLKRLIEIGLTGDVLDLAGTSVTLSRLIRTGCEKGGTQVGIERTGREKPLLVKRVVGAKGIRTHVDGHPNSNDITEFLGGVSEITLRALCNVAGFFNFKPADQKDLLLALVPQDVPASILEGLPIEGRVDPPKTFDDLEAAYDIAYKARKEKNRELDRVPIVDPEALKLKSIDLKDIEERLRVLEEERDALIKKSGDDMATVRTLTTERTSQESARDEAEADIQGYESREKIEAEIAILEAALADAETCERAYREGKEKIANLTAKLSQMHVAIAGLKAMQGRATCVVEPEHLKCPMKAAEKDKAVESLEARAALLQQEIEGLQSSLGEEPKPSEIRESLGECRRSLTALTRHIKDRDAAVAEIARIDARLKELPDQKEAETSLELLRQRIVKGREVLEKAKKQNSDRESAEKNKADTERLTVEVEAWDKLVEEFGPKGIRERLLVERVKTLVEKINEKLSRFGLGLSFVDDPWEVRISGTVSQLAAESELFRAGIALQVALAEVTGTGLVIVDGVDVLDGPNRKTFWTLITEGIKSGAVAQVIVTATYVEKPKKWPASWAAFEITGERDNGIMTSTIAPMVAAQKEAASA